MKTGKILFVLRFPNCGAREVMLKGIQRKLQVAQKLLQGIHFSGVHLEEALGSVEAASRYTFLRGSFRGSSWQRRSCFKVYISQGFIQRKLCVALKLLQGIDFSGVHLEETLGSVEAASRYTFLSGSFRGSSGQRRSCFKVYISQGFIQRKLWVAQKLQNLGPSFQLF